MVDVQCLSDYELHKQLKKLGFSSGPILPSTRKMYEKKLVQLLVSPPCELPVMKRPQKPPCELPLLHGFEDSDDSEDPAVNIVLKGNIKFSKDKGKECKKKPEASPSKRGTVDIYLSQKAAKGVRCAARLIPRTQHGCFTKEDSCQGHQSPGSRFLRQNPGNSILCQNPGNSIPWSLKLAILGIFIIVLFVYITVEKKPLLHSDGFLLRDCTRLYLRFSSESFEEEADFSDVCWYSVTFPVGHSLDAFEGHLEPFDVPPDAQATPQVDCISISGEGHRHWRGAKVSNEFHFNED
ncbi:LEM domain-containing protein 1 [Onychomys torridus]|uniref:LEM domain-containing protein 1 n=1 Tax=Onychomys torridus TaxID=38674 RepID=UPI00167F3137|nr:LEM domain-containing protein 1 [Onychomys torridus]